MDETPRSSEQVMANQTASIDSTKVEPLLRDCVVALQRVADYRLPRAMDNRLLWLGENKELLTEAERAEFLALAEFAEDRTLEKVQAQAVLRRVREIYPKIVAR
jgi:predicted ATPase